ncbi:conserved hypothetical protein [Burkholderia diffusa]|nr:conserved hypothetical protein [Burkholderia diffusa]
MLRGGISHDIAETFKWIRYMTHEDQYGLIGMHIKPGQEYYFPPSAPYYDRDNFQVRPVSADEIEPNEFVAIGVVRSDQKTDHEYGFQRIRVPYVNPVEIAQYGLVVNGNYFFSVLADGRLGERITIDRALREPRYIKISICLQKIEKAELDVKIEESLNRFTYWTSTGHRKERIGYVITDGKRTDWHDCFAEADGDHKPCSEVPNKR